MSPAAAARLVKSGECDFYNLYLTPDPDGSIWKLAAADVDLYEMRRRTSSPSNCSRCQTPNCLPMP